VIKFFRRFRQQLLTENKLRKYFLYAIGEIILVVIGILLALQLNTWNTTRDLKIQNQEFLTKMLAELKQNKDRLEIAVIEGSTGFTGLIKATKACDSLLKLTYKGLEQKDLPYVLSAQFDAGGTAYALNTSTHEELLNTGKLYSIGNNTLVKAITDYYKLYERELDYQQANAKYNEDAFLRLLRGFFKLRLDETMDPENFNIANYPYYFDPNSEKYQELQVDLNEMKIYQDLNLLKAKRMVTATDNLITVISNEIKSKDND